MYFLFWRDFKEDIQYEDSFFINQAIMECLQGSICCHCSVFSSGHFAWRAAKFRPTEPAQLPKGSIQTNT